MRLCSASEHEKMIDHSATFVRLQTAKTLIESAALALNSPANPQVTMELLQDAMDLLRKAGYDVPEGGHKPNLTCAPRLIKESQ